MMHTRVHGPSNEITRIDGSQVLSDNDGNTTMYGSSGYQYDEENRLIEATEGPLHTVRGVYQYDTFGRRVSKIDNFGNQTLYYYDGWRTIEEQNSAGVTQATYVFGNYLDEALTMDRGGHTYYYHQNALWSTFALTDPTGAGVEGYYYDAYGYQTVVLPGTDGILDFGPDDVYVPGAPSSVGNPFLFTEQRFDPETGLLYYKNRFYSAFFGRFLQRDPLDYNAADPNLYTYVQGRPTFAMDASGEQPFELDMPFGKLDARQEKFLDVMNALRGYQYINGKWYRNASVPNSATLDLYVKDILDFVNDPKSVDRSRYALSFIVAEGKEAKNYVLALKLLRAINLLKPTDSLFKGSPYTVADWECRFKQHADLGDLIAKLFEGARYKNSPFIVDPAELVPLDPAAKQEILKLLVQLGDDKYETRENATIALRELKAKARSDKVFTDFIRKNPDAMKIWAGDLETRRRLERIKVPVP
jgi:RHS repeat-associated protein